MNMSDTRIVCKGCGYVRIYCQCGKVPEQLCKQCAEKDKEIEVLERNVKRCSECYYVHENRDLKASIGG